MNTEPVERPARNVGLGLLLAILVANGVAHSVFVIAMPIIGRQLGLADVQTGVILTVSAVVMMLAAPSWGRYSERAGRRAVVAAGILASGIFLLAVAGVVFLRQSLLLTLPLTFCLLFGLRLLQAVGVGGVMPASQAYVADATGRAARTRGMGLMGAAFGAGTILGGAAAAILGQWVAVQGLLGLGALLLLVWWGLCRRLPEIRQPVPGRIAERGALPYATLWPMLLLTFCALLIYGMLQQVIGLRLQDQFGYSSAEALRATGIAMMLTMAVMVIVQLGFLRFVDWPAARVLRWGCGLLVLALTLATLSTGYGQLLMSMVLVGGAMGLVFPGNLALLSLAVGANAQGRIAGVNGVSKGLGLALGPVSGAALHQFSVSAPFVLGIVLALVMVLLAFWGSQPEKADTLLECDGAGQI
ncbi:MFS transporter [Microbulbifer harenosus]|uniref:MFS transporter n=1 Tax=Microbulbifer harenosus TaxID=2576840 RepID=UPI0014852AA4|nr:MFS transporter [Microbulbifer harenosus]